MGPQLNSGHVVALIDLGTNSVRLFVVRINENKSYTILNQHKIMVRLGEGEFIKHRLRNEAMDRTILVLERFAEMARSLGAEEIFAVATSATRDAENRDVFIERVRKEAKVDLKVISGLEEARLIYLGIVSGMNLGDNTALFIDIGGGSTETIVGNRSEYLHLDSLKLGAVRLTSLFFPPDETGPVSAHKYELLRQYVRNASLRSVQRLRKYRLDLAVGSSGTLETLAEMAYRQEGRKQKSSSPVKETPERVLTYRQLDALTKTLCYLPLEERKHLPGMVPERGDIIVAGASIIHTLMEEIGLDTIRISTRSLRNGLLVDYLMRGKWGYLDSAFSVREQSVLQLARSCDFHEEHSRHIGDLCMQLFDSGKETGLHSLGDGAKELLFYGALLHDIGLFLAFSNHHAHSHYIIRNVELLGFHDREIAVMAALAFFHRKRSPKKKDPEFADLDPDSQRLVFILSMFLRMAESLDRSHHELVRTVQFVRENDTLLLKIQADEGNQLEIWALEEHQKYFFKTFGENFDIRITSTGRRP